MEQTIYTAEFITKLLAWHWSMIGWGIALLLIILLLTPAWRHTWKMALLINGLGWLCSLYAGLTANWFIGWFAWVIPLSGILFLRFLMDYAMNLPYTQATKE